MRRYVLLAPALALAVGGCSGLFDPFKSTDAKITTNNFLQIGLALHNYDARWNRLLIHGATKGGSPLSQFSKEPPLLSWRVALLPHLEQDALYKQFNHDEPWDSEHNKKLIPLMPKIYSSPAKPAPEGHTYVQQLVGPGAVNPGRVMLGITDGLSNTAAVAEAAEAVPWTKPADIEVPKTFAPGALKAKFAGQFKGGFFVLLWDGSVSVVHNDTSESTLQSLCTPDGGEIVHRDQWCLFKEDGTRNR